MVQMKKVLLFDKVVTDHWSGCCWGWSGCSGWMGWSSWLVRMAHQLYSIEDESMYIIIWYVLSFW